MSDIIVRTADVDYTVRVQSGCLDQAGSLIAPLVHGRRAILVTDETVERLYSQPVLRSLREAGFETISFAMKPGEQSKSLAMLERVYQAMHLGGITRKDVVIALGGGTVGDMAGFAAATYQRGVKLVQIPTTLMAQVDSSIGGRTSLNTAWGRNQIGLSQHPWAVMIDPRTLRSLPRERLTEGMAAVIKYGVICDLALFERVAAKHVEFERVTERCVRIITSLLGEPGSESGERRLLKFGQIFQQAVLQLTGDLYYDGEALSIGMALATDFGEALGVTERGTAARLREVLESWQLPVAGPSLSVDAILGRIQANQLAAGHDPDRIPVVMLTRPGEAVYEVLPIETFMDTFRKVWSKHADRPEWTRPGHEGGPVSRFDVIVDEPEDSGGLEDSGEPDDSDTDGGDPDNGDSDDGEV